MIYLGWIGLCLVMISYLLLNMKNWKHWFLIMDAIGTAFLLAHGLIIQDMPFIIVNAFILIMLIFKQLKGGLI